MKSARKSRPKTEVENVRTGLGVEALKQAFRDNVFYIQGRYPRTATRNDLCMAVAYTVRDRLLQLFITSLDKLLQQDVRAVCYFSALFDIQVQRLHEYKRQHLNMLYAITLYNRLKRDSDADITTRVVIFGGKTARATSWRSSSSS